MTHATTLLAQVRQGLRSHPGEALDPEHNTGRLTVDVASARFRVRTAGFATQWLPDTPGNRHLAVVWLRLLVDERGRPWFTLQDLAPLVASTNRQAASQHLEDFRQCGEDRRAVVLRQRKVEATVVEAVLAELLHTPLAGPTELGPRVQARLGRHDLSVANIESALEQISCVPVLRALQRQLEAGRGQSQETALWRELLENLSPPAGPDTSLGVPRVDRGRRLADPTALAALVTPDLPLAPVSGSLCWLTFRMTLVYWTVPLSVLGRWCGVPKTTIRRWVVGLALALWPRLAQWMGERVQAQRVYVDETWLKIRGRWPSWFVVLAVHTELPVLTALLPSRRQWACRWLGRPLHWLKKVPQVLITDGLPAYAYLMPGAKHLWCRFHHQQGVTQWLTQPCATDAAIDARQPVMKRVLQPRDQRTVRRRLARLRERASELEITAWVAGVEAKLPRLLGRVGSVCLPSTTNAMERCFRAFERFYTTRQGVHSVLSAKRELRLLLMMDLFTQHATTGQAPIAVIVPEARRMPLSRVLNDPFSALQERASVKSEATMADLLRPQAAAA